MALTSVQLVKPSTPAHPEDLSHRLKMGQQEEEEEIRWRGRNTHLLLAFLQTDPDGGNEEEEEEEEAEGDPGREGEKLSGMNNGLRILRDRVKTLIMDWAQLEGPRGHLSRMYLRKGKKEPLRRSFTIWETLT